MYVVNLPGALGPFCCSFLLNIVLVAPYPSFLRACCASSTRRTAASDNYRVNTCMAACGAHFSFNLLVALHLSVFSRICRSCFIALRPEQSALRAAAVGDVATFRDEARAPALALSVERASKNLHGTFVCALRVFFGCTNSAARPISLRAGGTVRGGRAG